jgi:uncharacterized RDD family membrane protein YckC
MQTIRIQTSQNIELEYVLASVGDRLVAYLIDLLLYIGYSVGLILMADAFDGFGNRSWVWITLILPIFLYQLCCEVFLNGQSLGKKARQIRVISLDGNQPSIGQYLVRWLFRIVDDMIGSGVVAIVTISLTPKAQRVGDLLAGTTVVRINAQTSFQETIHAHTDEHYVPVYQQAYKLSDADISLLREVLNRYVQDPYAHGVLVEKAATKIRTILNVQYQGNASAFLETVIKDYNHLTGKAG